MAKYRPIYTYIWDDPDFQEMSVEGKVVFIYLCTNPLTTESGIYPCTPKTIANNTGVRLQTVKKLLTTDGAMKNVMYDLENRVVFVVNFFQYNGGGRPDLIKKAVSNENRKVNTWLWSSFVEKYPQFSEDIQTVVKPLSMGCGKVLSSSSSSSSSKSISNSSSSSIASKADSKAARKNPRSAKLSDDEFIKSLKANDAYKGIDIDRQLSKMDAWLSARPSRKKTRRFIVNWLNGADTPLKKAGGFAGDDRYRNVLLPTGGADEK